MSVIEELRIPLPLSINEFELANIYKRYRLRHRTNAHTVTQIAQWYVYYI